MAKKNPRFKTDNGSGMANQDAVDLIAEFQKLPNFAEFDRLATDHVDLARVVIRDQYQQSNLGNAECVQRQPKLLCCMPSGYFG